MRRTALFIACALALLSVSQARVGGFKTEFSSWISATTSQISGLISQFVSTPESEPTEDDFTLWKAEHNVVYDSPEEHKSRYAIYKDNMKKIEAHNAEGHSFTVAANQFADKTADEFKQLFVPKTFEHTPSNGAFRYADVEVPAGDTKDWREEGAVTYVKNQGQCGSCWSFSTTGSIEGITAVKTGQLKPLSEQELVDCDVAEDHGCGGGLMDYAFRYVVNNGGLDSEEDYPYVAHQQQCHHKKEKKFVAHITGYEDVPAYDEPSLLKAASQQPISIAVAASNFAFQFYRGGVIDSFMCGSRLDHGVLLAGYGVDDVSGKKYWLVKNSWGDGWGEDGYLRILRQDEMSGQPGMCGIAMQPSYPTLDDVSVAAIE